MTENYRVLKFDGKGYGVVAAKDAMRGSLILKESPQIILQKTDDKIQNSINLKAAFNALSKDIQDEYMKLSCNYTSGEV